MLLGKRISGRYKLLQMIGGGGMANVYLAHDMILDRDVAIKILRLDFAHEDEFIRRFQREAQSATSLTHENIVSIYDVGEEDDIYYIVMEYVDGMTLKQYIQYYHPIPLEHTLDIMKQLTSAISHAHHNHIVHRDIKPQNILVDHHGHVMITDFGIAMALSATSITQTNAVLGSVHYLSPEQARGGMATKKSDIYSLGIVMFELLTGRLPFSGESAVSIALKHLQSETPSPKRWNPGIPQSVENIILKATAKDPFLRYESADEMARDLETALDINRINEPKFTIPEDIDATKAIPVITAENDPSINNKTILHKKEQAKKSNEPVKKPKRKKKWPWIIGIFIMLMLLSLVFVSYVLPAIQNAKIVKIPDVSGEEYDDAVVRLVDAGLKIGKKIQASSDEVPEGVVIKTSPKASMEVKKGYSVDIYISTGKDKFILQDYTGRQISEIENLLRNEGFEDPKIDEVFNEAPVGEIIEQSLSPNTPVIPEETVLSFVVSKGEEKITLKDLRGLNSKGVESYAESSGLNIDMTNEQYSDEVPEGLVISQDPAPNSELSKGERVTVVISKGKEEIPPKTTTKKVTIPYEPSEEGKPQVIVIRIEDYNHPTMSVPVDTFTITETTERELEFTIAKGNTAKYEILRDNTVIEADEVPYPGD
ncbi:Stk1 family PASTA domain-containing Ser/Thr kinase [Lederbergia wuyishanensis]|uniref:non-specific serine/threonine protein kinase n=1 Tax=Lederbergia wuyishanensis TaxID=1347903 RepID=A0ABU0CZL1_9BACI|nr:Stk1 family PASTA domain-containing Ser/Thr kinase [Lederbergia wuyishanensis]MCJ8006218.1 Stk1 family PASTA domain-containing Ser/Thr kinase [Lederbergia wuyishanensis]MDQ0341588.1 serine/threonine-protein kinase [Lederbergia wuyishanensis]